jgi:Uma2 family endonuclease
MPRGVWRYELVKGELRRMSPAGHTHGRIAARVLILLAQHVEPRKLGNVYAAETGFVLVRDPDTVRAPDVAFVGAERLAGLHLSAEGFFPGAPDLAVEVVSPSDTYTEVEGKVMEWLRAGARAVIVVDPRKENASVYRSFTEIAILTGSDRVLAEDLLPGWSVSVNEFFT